MEAIKKPLQQLADLDCQDLLHQDFLLTWDKSDDAIKAVLLVADILKSLRTHNISPRIFSSGLAISQFRDHSTRTRFSFASACNLLGLAVQDLDEGKSQIAHGETVRETSNMIAFMADVFGIRDDLYIGKGHAYMQTVASCVQQGFAEGILEQRPTIINLQSDLDHPTQTLADLQHLIRHFGGVEQLRGKKIAMTWAYSPSYGKPLSVPQGIIALMTRMGMDVTLAHPPGYDLLPEVEEIARINAASRGCRFSKTDSLQDAFSQADIVYPKSWAPYDAMKKRTALHDAGDLSGIVQLEQALLKQNAGYQDWECTENLMSSTKDGKALYLHCLPADISGVSCTRGEVEAQVFERYRTALYQQASWKPYIIAAMILLSKIKKPAASLKAAAKAKSPRFSAAGFTENQ